MAPRPPILPATSAGTFDNLNPTSYNVNRVPSIDYVNLAVQYTVKTSRLQNLQYFIK